jgi:conserved oligomeric Golgi complex subunit 3
VHLIQCLDTSISDTQERLSYCAEKKLRQDIQSFEPRPSQLNYPDIIEAANTHMSSINTSNNANSSNSSDDVSRSWFPTLKATLALLSKLYGIVDMAIFEDFACRCLSACITTLSNAATLIRKKSGMPLQGNCSCPLLRRYHVIHTLYA